MYRWIVLLFPLLFVLAAPGSARTLSPLEIDFGQDLENPNFMTARELEIRARNLNLVLLPDDPGRNLQDFRAETIPASGLNFQLRAPGSGRVYLYLDMVAFAPMEQATELKVRWLEIFVNGHRLRTIHQGGGAFPESPQVLLIEREHTMDRELRVQLRPSPGDGFFAIWDAYVSRQPPADSTQNQELRAIYSATPD